MRVPRSISAGSIMGPRSRKLLSWTAMAFIMTVLRISFTPRRAFRMPGMPPQTAPASAPTTRHSGRSTKPGRILETDRHGGGCQGADQDLPFAADVDHPAAEGDAHPQPDQQQGGGLGQGLGDPGDIPKGAGNEGAISFERVGPQGQHHDGADDKSHRHRQEGQKGVDRAIEELIELLAIRHKGQPRR